MLWRAPDRCLIVRPTSGPDAVGEFPGERVESHEIAEHVLVRLCTARLGVCVDELIPQPAFTHGFGTHTVTCRYYICPVSADEVVPLGYAEVRWVAAPQLREYVFDAAAQTVVERLAAGVKGR